MSQYLCETVDYHKQSHTMSSVNLISLDADTFLSISTIIIKKRRGSKTDVCGAPLNS